MAGVNDTALRGVRLILASTMPDASNDEYRVTFLHFASGAKRSVGGTGDGGLGPLVGADNNLCRTVFEVGILKQSGVLAFV